jgi:hypothetical protein
MTAADDTKVRVLLAKAMMGPCLMCGGRPDGAGLFVPYSPEDWGARPGKARLIAYALCDHCEASTSIEDREDKLARRMGKAV